MSDNSHDEGEELPPALQHFLLAQAAGEETAPLRWTPLTVLVDICEALAVFFAGQARSLAARATFKEELRDRKLRLKFQRQARKQMRKDTLEDIAALPETGE